MKKCFECEKTEDQIEIHDHHVVPRSKGGTKTIPLCYVCHAIVHNKKSVSISELTKTALKKKRKNGYRTGTIPYGFTVGKDGKKLIIVNEQIDILTKVESMRKAGHSYQYIADDLNSKGILNLSLIHI